MNKRELSKPEVYELLLGAGVTFDYYRGVFTFWIDSTKYFVHPCRFGQFLWTEYPIYKAKDFEVIKK